MKVHIGPYKNWFGPYQLADLIFFWLKKYPEEKLEERWDYRARDKFADFLAGKDNNKTWFYKLCLWIEEHRKRKIKIRIDNYDTWSMDHTLALIVLPMLKQLQATKHGSPMVDAEDVPEELRMTGYDDGYAQFRLKFEDDEQYEKESWDITHRRWEWVLNEMIFAFEHLVDDSWEEAYRSGHIDMKFIPCEDNPKLSTMVDGPNHTYKCDYDGMKKVYDRMDNGFRLFGKYYRSLWD
jgi:hypothetical protein